MVSGEVSNASEFNCVSVFHLDAFVRFVQVSNESNDSMDSSNREHFQFIWARG